MRILLSSHFFAPSVGGIQEVSGILAHQFVTKGHQVVVITQTRETGTEHFPFEVIRNPSPGRLMAAVRDCDVFFQNNISLQTLWPLLLGRKPWVVAHHSWICRGDGSIGWRDRLKLSVVKRATRNIAVSSALAEGLLGNAPCRVIGNPYRDDLFRNRLGPRERDVVFLGRMTPDKGASVLAKALVQLAREGVELSSTFVGSGPEREGIQKLTSHLPVEFVGECSRSEIATILNRHRYLVVPSTIDEPFGIAAIEGIASGCCVIGSNGGGLPDAIGPCGVTFEKGNVDALAKRLRERPQIPDFEALAALHLKQFRAEQVATEYLAVLEEAVACWR